MNSLVRALLIASSIGVFSVWVNAAVAAGPAEAGPQKDPWESINRVTFTFNDYLDRYFLKPVAEGYTSITPDFMQEGISNFFSNLGEPLNILNGLLQGKPLDAGNGSLRMLVNTTVGLFGFIDIGSRIGLPEYDEDFGQTLGVWGVDSGPYLVLPIFGPSTVRDAVGRVPDGYLSPTRAVVGHEQSYYAFTGLDVVSVRAKLLDKERLMAGDRYSFLRDAYLQNREFKVTDGKGNADEDPFADDGFSDTLLFEDEISEPTNLR